MSDERKQKCFVIMPFTVRQEDMQRYHGDPNHWNEVYHGLIVPAVNKAGMTCERDDEDAGSRLITENICRKLEEADVILCDLSASNPNVYLELGWTLRADKKFVLIKDELTPFHFDLNQCFTCEYSHLLQPTELNAAVDRLESALRTTAEDQAKRYSIVRKLSLAVHPIESAKGGGLDARMLGQVIEEIRHREHKSDPEATQVLVHEGSAPVVETADDLVDWLPGTAWKELDGTHRITFLHGGALAFESPVAGASLGEWHPDDLSPNRVFLRWGARYRSAPYGFNESHTQLAEVLPGGAVWDRVIE